MPEERRLLSLRSGNKRRDRLKISAPQQISAPIPQDGSEVSIQPSAGARPGGPAPVPGSGSLPARPRPPPSSNSRTGDLVKRRYSTRFNNLPENYDASAPPPMPSFDVSKYEQPQPVSRPQPSRGRGEEGSVVPVVDKAALGDPRLAVEQYVADILSEADEEAIRVFEAELQKTKAKASAELQQNVLQNRTQFIKVSKEAEKLRAEMRSLKSVFEELKSNTAALMAASGNANDSSNGDFPSGLSKRDKRSSVADRTALWNSQMQALYKKVEGSQKFLPSTMGRHVVQDAGAWIELDNATYKSRRSMQLVLLNDHLLIASRKKRKVDAPNDGRGPMVKLVADRCWPLLDIEIVDMAGAHENYSGRNKLADAVMVRGVGQESFIYRTEKPEDPEKGKLMLNIRKAVEELRKGLQSEMEANNKAKETINYFASRDPGLLQKTELLETLSDIKDMLIEVDGKQQNLRWVEGEMDELDIDIALQRFDLAVDRVDKLKSLARGLKNNVIAQDFINFKVQERCSKLSGLITRELVETHGERSKTKRNVDWLSRLGFEDRARESYLEARSTLIQKRSRQCIFQGDLHVYIWQLSFAYFSIIRNTVACFQACFPQAMMSACVKWAKEEVDAFNVILSRQLSSTDRGGAVWEQCMSQAKTHAKMLEDVHLDFTSLVGKDITEVSGSGATIGLGLVA